MKNIHKLTILTICAVFLFSGCNGDNPTQTALSPVEIERLENAGELSDISDVIATTVDDVKYSECDDDSDLMMYFGGLACADNKYYIVSHGGENYVLFRYGHIGNPGDLASIGSIAKEYSGNALNINVDAAFNGKIEIGCFTGSVYANCIVKLDRDIAALTVDNYKYTKYDGGIVHIGKKYGVLDKDMNVIVPMKYDILTEFLSPGSKQKYYRFHEKGHNGIMDEDFNIILEAKYLNIVFVNDDKFVVMEYNIGGDTTSDTSSNCTISAVDRSGNVICGPTDGFIDAAENFNNIAHQAVFSRGGHKGVIDEDLNVIIEPEYDSIWKEGTDTYIFYVVTKNDNHAVFDTEGAQKTAFENSTVYEVSEKYRKSMHLR